MNILLAGGAGDVGMYCVTIFIMPDIMSLLWTGRNLSTMAH
ncbi:hypothetical protein Ga0466249_004971 [Sporomusaceae bacterium BoRhaA]|nr:hypothetical protein [Pelorhabdus rhamnosifermentans]MBU2703821.1 hypothetical protein [Pelorhabdus rhamnosifermentans]